MFGNEKFNLATQDLWTKEMNGEGNSGEHGAKTDAMIRITARGLLLKLLLRDAN